MSNSFNVALLNKILSEYQRGEKVASFNKLKKYLNQNPNDQIAKYNFAFMASELNSIDIAIEKYKEIIQSNKNHWRSRFNLYLIYISQKKYEIAIKLVNEVLKIKPNYQPALRDKAIIYYYTKRADEGLPFILKSLKENPNDYIALNTLGLIYMDMKKYENSKKVFNKAIEINSNYFPSYNNLGRCFNLQNNKKMAYSYYKKAIEINPNFQEAINNIANYYNEIGKYNKAIAYYLKALEKGKRNFEVLYNIAISYLYLKDYKKSEEYYKKSFEINQNDEKCKKNYSFLLLALQKYKEAWPYFESRLGLDEFRLKNDFINNTINKLWRGGKLNIKEKILIIKEQGVGDEILYSSMYPDFLKKYSDVKIETDPRLISLFKRSFKKNDVFVPYSEFSKNKNKLKEFNKIIYAGSLGRLFRNSLNEFPRKEFLKVDKNNFLKIQKVINNLNLKGKIGISWRSKNETYGVDKSLNLDLLLPILSIKKLNFINLQYGETEKEIKEFTKKTKLNIIDIKEVDLFNDIEGIAALLKNLDLLITVSNSTAHIAGALGVPTWLIKPKNHVALHYWNQPKNSSPWYSSIKLFPYENGWGEVINNVRRDLEIKFKISH